MIRERNKTQTEHHWQFPRWLEIILIPVIIANVVLEKIKEKCKGDH